MSRYRSYRLAAGLALLTDISAWACKCLPPESAAEALADAETVFSGSVIDIVRVNVEDDGLGWTMNRVTFRVIETWKGQNSDTKIVLTGLGGGDCGFNFAKDSDYLVYAYGESLSGTYATSICTRNRLLSAAEDRSFLGEGQKPDRPLLNVVRDQGTTTFTWLTNWVNFRVEIAESLEAPLAWRPLSNYVGTLGPYHVVTNRETSSRSFFRLAH